MAGQDLATRSPRSRSPHHGDGDGPRIAAIDTGIKGSRSCATSSQRGARVALHPCPRRARPSCWPRTPTRSSWPTARATPRRSATSSRPCASSSAASRCGASASATSCCARPSACETYKLPFGHRGANHPVKDLRDRPHRDHLARTTASRCARPTAAGASEADEPVRWETDFGAAALTHVNLYDRTVEGLQLLDVNCGDGAVPPRGRPGPQRRAVPVRPLPGGGHGRRRPCRVGTTSTRS